MIPSWPLLFLLNVGVLPAHFFTIGFQISYFDTTSFQVGLLRSVLLQNRESC